MVDNALNSQAFKFKGRLYTFTVLQLISTDGDLFAHQLGRAIAKAPKLFDNAPVVLDCSGLDRMDFDLQAICECLRQHHLIPIGIQGCDPALAQSQGLPILNASSSHDKPLIETHEPVHTAELKTKLLTAPVRSGQQIINKHGDLIITASVSYGAELLAEGNIHIYGTLRGRALAGISGNQEARIFCQALDAELISIAGFYRLSDSIEPQPHPCQIYLKNDHIQIERLC